MEAGHREGGQAPKHRGPIPLDEIRVAAELKPRDGKTSFVPTFGPLHRALADDVLEPVAIGPAAADELRHEAAERALAAAEGQRVRAQRERRSRQVAAWTLVASLATLAVAIVTLAVSARS